MSLFDLVTSAIANPNQQASTNQLGGILQAVSQLSGQGSGNQSTSQMIMALAGRYLKSNLQQRRQTDGDETIMNLVQQFSGTQADETAVSALLSGDQQEELAQEAASQTGLDKSAILSMLPVAIPLVMNLLKTGQGNASNANGLASNSVLTSFLDADGDGDTDINDMLLMAGKYMQNR
ncbi:MAG: hypothetical protein AAF268_09025 [Cyanobacteria bacterium P01_A01_bin.3]